MSIEDEKSSGDPSHPYFSRAPITREEDAYNTRPDQPDPAGELGIDPDGLTTPSPAEARGERVHTEVAAQDEAVSDEALLLKEGKKPLTRGQLIWRRFSRSKTAMGGLIGFILIVVFAIVGRTSVRGSTAKSTTLLSSSRPRLPTGSVQGKLDATCSL